MKILVALKPVPDPEQKLKITNDKFDFSNRGIITNPFDEYALEAALRLTDKIVDNKPVRNGEILAVSIGKQNESRKILKNALGLGVNKVIHIESNDDDLDFSIVARALLTIVNQESPDLILLGKQSVDGDAALVPQFLAGLLNYPQATFASKIKDEGDTFLVTREIDEGIEIKRVSKPSVISVDLGIVAPNSVTPFEYIGDYQWSDGPRYPSIRGMLKTRSAVIESIPLGTVVDNSQLILSHWSPEFPPQRSKIIMVDSAKELAEKIKSSIS
jgi:electron transfer flavoprotein beta subunit